VVTPADVGYGAPRRATKGPVVRAPNPQPGQVWYAWVPFDDEDDGKDRPCLVLDRHDDLVDVLKITSRDSRDRAGYIRIPTASWDPAATTDSWLRLHPPVRLAVSDGVFRRRLGLCDSATWRAATRGRGRERIPTRGGAVAGAIFSGTVAALSGLCALSGLMDPGSRAIGVVALIAAVMAGLVCLERVVSARGVTSGGRAPAVRPSSRDPAPGGAECLGTVDWFDPERGYGFIDTDDGGRAFVHHSAIRTTGYRMLNEGQRVSFRPVPSERGPRAEDVHPLD
jgi:cold shock CspA family protein